MIQEGTRVQEGKGYKRAQGYKRAKGYKSTRVHWYKADMGTRVMVQVHKGTRAL